MSKDIEKKKILFKRNIIITVVLMIAMGVGGVVAYNTFFKKTVLSVLFVYRRNSYNPAMP